MTNIPADIIDRFDLEESKRTLQDLFKTKARIYILPSLNNKDIKVYLFESDLEGNPVIRGRSMPW